MAGGGPQPAGLLPVVFICRECVEVCNLAATTQSRASDDVDWMQILYDGSSFEWRSVNSSLQGNLVIVRRTGSARSAGMVVAEANVVTAEHALAAIQSMLDRLG
jgi:hypothetical protein